MKATLPHGIQVEGTPQEIVDLLKLIDQAVKAMELQPLPVPMPIVPNPMPYQPWVPCPITYPTVIW